MQIDLTNDERFQHYNVSVQIAFPSVLYVRASYPYRQYSEPRRVPFAPLKNERGVMVYLPPGYRRGKQRRYPVLYLQDGGKRLRRSDCLWRSGMGSR